MNTAQVLTIAEAQGFDSSTIAANL